MDTIPIDAADYDGQDRRVVPTDRVYWLHSHAALKEAIAPLANASSAVGALPIGYDCVVGENGEKGWPIAPSKCLKQLGNRGREL